MKSVPAPTYVFALMPCPVKMAVRQAENITYLPTWQVKIPKQKIKLDTHFEASAACWYWSKYQ